MYIEKETRDSEEAREIGNSGNRVGTYANWKVSVSGRFLALQTEMQLCDVTVV